MSRKTKNTVIELSIWGGIAVTVFLLLLSVLSAEFAAIRALSVMIMIAVVHYSNSFIAARTLMKGNRQKYFAQVFLLLIVLAFLRYLLERFVFPPQTQPGFFRENHFRPVFFFGSAVMVCFVSSVVLYAVRFSEKEKELLQTINAHNEARMQYLQSQINPHFLFNTLNNIYSLVITHSKNAPDMLLRLTELLRYSVYRRQGEKVLVSDEAKQIEFLIELFSLRRDEPYNIEFEKRITNGIIEPMILIPLAENCLKHCDSDLNENAFVKMKLNCNNETLLFETENTFDAAQQKGAVGGVGLRNIRERLQLIYGKNFSFKVSAAEKIFRTELCIQWKK